MLKNRCFITGFRTDFFKTLSAILFFGAVLSSVHSVADDPRSFPETPNRDYDQVENKTYIEAGATLPKKQDRAPAGLPQIYTESIDKSGAEAQFGIAVAFKGKRPKSMKHVKVVLSLYLRRWKKYTQFKELESTSSLPRNNFDFIYSRDNQTPLNCLAFTGPSLNNPEDTFRLSLPTQKVDREKTHLPSINEAVEKRTREITRRVSQDTVKTIEKEYYVMVEPITFVTHERIFYEQIPGTKALKLFSHNLALDFPFGKTATLPNKITNGLENILKNLEPRR